MIALLSSLISRNALALAAIAGLIAWGQITLKNHDRNVEQRAVAQTVTKIETANADAIKAGQEAARKSVAPPMPPPRKPLARRLSRKQPVSGATVDPTSHDD